MNSGKLDPALIGVLEDYDSEGEAGLATHARALGINPAAGQPRPPSVVVFIHCDPKAPLASIRESGGVVNGAGGEIRTAVVPLMHLGALSEDPDVQRVIGARYLRPRMDVAAGRVRLPQFRTGGSLTGAGVIIGIVDTGIDSGHPMFAGRILSVWDQTVPGPGVIGAPFGMELKGPAIAMSRDTHGHGTHVAGIAAGDHSTFGGVAPGADLVIVKTSFQDAHILEGVRYIARVARELDRPAVINLSLGGHADPHDGSDSLARAIDQASGPGIIVCCAAGNEGSDNIHGRAVVAPNDTHRMRFRIPSSIVGIAELNGWYSGSARLEIAISSPTGFATPFQPVVTAGNPSVQHELPDARVRIITPRPDPELGNGDHNFLVQIRGLGPGTPVPGGVWRLHVRNVAASPVAVDVWTLDDHEAPQVAFSGNSAHDALKIGSPGSARSAITVASFTTRTSWTDLGGVAQRVALQDSNISEFSSEGPLRDGTPKPDIAAPGAMVASALSSFSSQPPATMISSDCVVMSGTSMAAPFVSGVTALLLQKDRSLDSVRLKNLLGRNAVIPGQPPGTFDPKWGVGLLDAVNL